jgi:predicted nucleotidyltransferase component of viral defense system
LCSIKIEVTLDESVLLPPVVRPLIHDFDEPLSATMHCYALEEIVAEKLRALLQTRAHLDQRGWARPRARDYFDLWQLLVHRGVPLDRATVGAVLPRKCRVRGVDFVTAADFFAAAVIERARLDWSQDLPRLADDVPGFDRCLSDLCPQIEQIVALR